MHVNRPIAGLSSGHHRDPSSTHHRPTRYLLHGSGKAN